MTEAAVVPQQYRAQWQFKGSSKPATADYIADNLIDLRTQMAMDGVSHYNVDFMYVHQFLEDGSVLEVVTYDNRSAVPNPSVPSTPNKPHVRVVAPITSAKRHTYHRKNKKNTTVKSYLYHAEEW